MVRRGREGERQNHQRIKVPKVMKRIKSDLLKIKAQMNRGFDEDSQVENEEN